MTMRGLFFAVLFGVIIGNAPRLFLTEDQALAAGKLTRGVLEGGAQ